MSILIYQDDGVSTDSANALLAYFSGQNARFVTASDLQNDRYFSDATVLIMPGGRSLPFYEKLGERGNQHIKNFVLLGGCYVGLCAGAYYAATKTIFAKDRPLELLLNGPLHFFPGDAVGPIFAANEFAYGTEKGAQTIEVVLENNTVFPVYFNGGCYFEHAEQFQNTRVLARYAINQLPAIIVCTAGKGRAILSGVHPELSDDQSLLILIGDDKS